MSIGYPVERDTDGFTVFPDSDKELNEIRKTGTREEIIVAVATRRAQQIAINYATKYAPDLVEGLKIAISKNELLK